MHTKHIVTQDRDKIFPFNPRDPLYTYPVYSGGCCMGINLMLGRRFLGTFDSPMEALTEIVDIFSHSGEIYAVKNFSDWRGDV